jgi:hypothetical protein
VFVVEIKPEEEDGEGECDQPCVHLCGQQRSGGEGREGKSRRWDEESRMSPP